MEFLKKLFSPVTATLSFISNHFKALIFVLILFLIFAPGSEETGVQNNLQRIDVVGPIVDSEEIVTSLDEAKNNDAIKGVLVVINSPGGGVSPSLEIAEAIKRTQVEKPVVVYGTGTMASGGYYAAIWADKIYANPGALIGSIGVIMQGADIEGLLNKIGVKMQSIQAGEYKQIGTFDRPWSSYEKEELEKVVNGIYDMFVTDVATARDLNLSNSDAFADAHIFTGSQALKVGLIDEVGMLEDAQAFLSNESNVTTPVWNKESKLEQFINSFGAHLGVLAHKYYPSITLK